MARRQPTFDELYRQIVGLPPGQTGEIVEEGVVRTMARPGRAHRRAARRLARLLDGVDVDRGGEWWIDDEAEVRFGERLFVSDLAGWRVADGDLDFAEENPIVRTPDWACEVLSRTTQRGDRFRKLPVYAAAGVAHVWVLDLDAGVLEVYEPRGGVPAMIAGARVGEPVRLPPFDLEIDLAALLARPKLGAR